MDDVTVANMALASIGTRCDIASLTEGSPESNVVQLFYNQTRDELLRKIQWNWARAQLSATVFKAALGTPENPTGVFAQPAQPWLYSYAYPSDCLNLRYILPLAVPPGVPGVPLTPIPQAAPIRTQTPAVRWIEAGDLDGDGNPLRVVLTNQMQAQFVYTRRITNANVWDDLFVTALVGRLAGKVCIPLAGDKGLMKIAMMAGAQAEQDADSANGNESVQVNDWILEQLESRGYEGCDDGNSLYIGSTLQDIT